MKATLRQRLAARKRQIQRRLDKTQLGNCARPVFTASNIRYEIADRVRGLAFGGIGAMHLLARQVGLIDAIDDGLPLLKVHLPYHESDHVLNIAYNALCNGTCLQDIELRRNDAVFLDALGARRIPDPTTAGDFCRRFDAATINRLQDIFDDVRIGVWRQQPAAFFDQAIARRRRHAGRNHRPLQRGHGHRLRRHLGLSPLGRFPGQHPRGAAVWSTAPATAPRTKAPPTPWTGPSPPVCAAVFAASCSAATPTSPRPSTSTAGTGTAASASSSATTAKPTSRKWRKACPNASGRNWSGPTGPSPRPSRGGAPTTSRTASSANAQYETLRLSHEDIADWDYRPHACSREYRLIVVRKNISREKGELRLFDEIRYFFYLTNDYDSTPEQIVCGAKYGANHRCDQENLLAQLHGGCHALARAGGQLGEQLGLHGHDGVGLEPQGVGRPDACRKRPAAGRTSTGPRSCGCWAWSSRPSSTP